MATAGLPHKMKVFMMIIFFERLVDEKSILPTKGRLYAVCSVQI